MPLRGLRRRTARNLWAKVRERERERERESLTYKSLECPRDTFSIISYRYVKIPESDPDVFCPDDPPVDYPFYYPFSFLPFSFSHKLLIVIAIQKKSEKNEIFSDLIAFFIHIELPLAMLPPAWSAGVFFIYGCVLLPSSPDNLPCIRAPPLWVPPFGQTPESPLRRCACGLRDAHVERFVNSPQEDFPLRK